MVTKFRVWDSVLKQYVCDDVYINCDGIVYINHLTQLDYGAILGNLTEIGCSFILELNTGFTDSEGKEIFQHDVIHVMHTGQDSACMKPEGYDYHVDWSADKGQWVLYSYDLGFRMFFAPLFMYARKGVITGRHGDVKRDRP